MKLEQLIKSAKRRIIAVDFDDTIARASKTGEPFKGVREVLERLKAKGFRIYIYTARLEYDKEYIESYLLKYKIPYNQVKTGKLKYFMLIDDKAFNFNFESWADAKKPIDNFIVLSEKNLQKEKVHYEREGV